MIKYKLKKDTFFYKAGTICKLTPKGNMILDGNEGTCILHDYQFKEHPKLLEEWFEKIEGKKYGGRVPKKGDMYWFIASSGSVFQETWDGAEWDTQIFECGSAFWSREEAEKELKRRKAYVILKEDTKGFVPDWKNVDAVKYAVFYEWRKSIFGVCLKWGNQEEVLIFATEEDARASIKAHRQEWLDYLGIEEEE